MKCLCIFPLRSICAAGNLQAGAPADVSLDSEGIARSLQVCESPRVPFPFSLSWKMSLPLCSGNLPKDSYLVFGSKKKKKNQAGP